MKPIPVLDNFFSTCALMSPPGKKGNYCGSPCGVPCARGSQSPGLHGTRGETLCNTTRNSERSCSVDQQISIVLLVVIFLQYYVVSTSWLTCFWLASIFSFGSLFLAFELCLREVEVDHAAGAGADLHEGML